MTGRKAVSGSRAYLIEEDDSPYNQEYLDAMRDLLPKWARDYDASAKHWLIDASWLDELLPLLREHFDIVTMVEPVARARPPQAPPHSPLDCLNTVRSYFREEATVGVFPPAEDEKLVTAAYRARSMRLHPDIAGPESSEAMKALNRARDVLLRRCEQAAENRRHR
jgi:hypothetical protein